MAQNTKINPPLADCTAVIARFTGNNLASKIAALEFDLVGMDKERIGDWLTSAAINQELFSAAKIVKQAAAQIDVVLHALGILVILPLILKDQEIIESLSLGAGSSETKRFDLETNLRIAEFTFIDWRGNDNTRLQKIFKDFYRLAEFPAEKLKELWVSDDTYVLKYLRSRTSVRSATHKHRDVWETFQSRYPEIQIVSDYYRRHGANVSLKVYDRDAVGFSESPWK
jgi:hypothetical protein